MTQVTLDAARITAIIAGGRTRGGKEARVKRFMASGELYDVLSDSPEWQDKNVAGLKQQFKAVCTKLELPVTVISEGDMLALVNTDVLAEQANADSEDEASDEDSETVEA